MNNNYLDDVNEQKLLKNIEKLIQQDSSSESFIFSQSQTYEHFFLPVSDHLKSCQHTWACPELSDSQWIEMGVCRSLMDVTTGRGFLQQYNPLFQNPITYTHFFKSLKSSRRLRLCDEFNQRLCQQIQRVLPDPLAPFKELNQFDIYAGDGHWHGAAAHDKLKDGRKWAVGHFYTLNLRNHAINHLEMADEVERKHEHDMRALKRQSIKALRQGAPKGRKVIYAWDSACLDYEQWDYWKQTGGIYFVTRFKDNLLYDYLDDLPVDPLDGVNHGVLSDQLIMPTGGKKMRRIECVDPATGKVHVFLTNEMSLSAGLLAQIYRLRWDVEKVFDEFKNNFQEKKAWASSDIAKTMQAHFLCMTHNLLQLMNYKMQVSFDVYNVAESKRKENRLEKLNETAGKAGRKVSDMYQIVKRFSKISLKFIRCLRTYFCINTPLSKTAAYLRRLYAEL